MSDVTLSTPTRPARATRAPLPVRLAALSHAVEGVRRRPRIDVRQALLVSGSTAMGLGMVAIVLGWYGAAHSAYLFQEIPYLISGGLLGVALVAGGGFLFFGAFVVRAIEENRQFAERVERTLAHLDAALMAAAADATPPFPRHATNGSGTGAAASGPGGSAHSGAAPRLGDDA